MTDADLTKENRNILAVLRNGPKLRLREIHDALVKREKSKFQYSPEFGAGWNDERREVRSLCDDLANLDLVTNDYQLWDLTREGRELLS